MQIEKRMSASKFTLGSILPINYLSKLLAVSSKLSAFCIPLCRVRFFSAYSSRVRLASVSFPSRRCHLPLLHCYQPHIFRGNHLPVCLSDCLFLELFVYRIVSLHVVCLFLCLYPCLLVSDCLSTFLPIFPFIYVCVRACFRVRVHVYVSFIALISFNL